MSFSIKNTIFVLVIGLLVLGGAAYFFFGTSPERDLQKIKDETPRTYGGNEAGTTEESGDDQAALTRNCAKEIPASVDDVSFDPEKKVVRVYWTDSTTSDNVSLALPYEPEKDFAGCSESVKEILRRVQQTQS